MNPMARRRHDSPFDLDARPARGVAFSPTEAARDRKTIGWLVGFKSRDTRNSAFASDEAPLASYEEASVDEGEVMTRLQQTSSAWVSKGILLALGFAFSGALIAFVDHESSSQVAAQSTAKIEASIFSYDGQDFVRVKTTLVTEKGDSAVNTKLEHDTAAYKALIQKRSYTGEVNVFGRKYAANYAPLIGEDGKLTGALFVAVTK
jgi:hypothetical protein